MAHLRITGSVLLLFACFGSAAAVELVPVPQRFTVKQGTPGCVFDKTLVLELPPGEADIEEHFRVFADAVSLLSQGKLKIATEAASSTPRLTVKLDRSLAREEYQLNVRDNRIFIKASSLKGITHATATLLQLLGNAKRYTVPVIAIRDRPDCPYRSVMIDLGRNPHSLECLQETIDLLWYYRLDSLHLHLTDDQRFAFPSKAFPKLVTKQGLITWEEFQALERYARVRGITLIPELDVPGHSSLLRKHYPEIFGKSATDVARLPAARRAIKQLLEEMIEVFASTPYVHVGGDEAYGVREELQRELINDLHAHLKQKGKKTLVWEGPTLGVGANKVNEDVIHLNWRTINFPADQMLAAGYPVVNASWDPLYVVDHYPRNNFTLASPQHLYETLNLTRFKHFNPDIPTFANPVRVQPSKNLLGFCLPWWEGREENFFPLVVPRVIPMGAIAWNAKSERNFAQFQRRSRVCETIRQRCFYPVRIAAMPLVLPQEGVFHQQAEVSLSTTSAGKLRYTLDGSTPTASSPRYKNPFMLKKTAVVRAACFVDDKQVGHGSRKTYVGVEPVKNLALGKPVVSSVSSGPLFSVARLTDGGTGNLDYYLGYPAQPQPIQITIDFEEVVPINRIVTHSFFNGRAYEAYRVLVSRNGKRFTQVADRREKPDKITAQTVHNFPTTSARYVRIETFGCQENVFRSFSRLTEIQVFMIPPVGAGTELD